MIEACELRVGNNVLHLGKIIEVESVSANRNAINLDFWEGGYGDAGSLDCIKLSEVEPIPITAEILGQAGFVINYQSEFHKTFEIVGNEQFTYRIWRTPILPSDQLHFRWRGRGILCLYVHQLQNLYFAITGEELTINL